MATKLYGKFNVTAGKLRESFNKEFEKEKKDIIGMMSYSSNSEKERKEANALYNARHLALMTVADAYEISYDALRRVLVDSGVID